MLFNQYYLGWGLFDYSNKWLLVQQWTQSSLELLQDPLESSSQHQTTSIRWVTDTNEVLIISYEIIFFQLLRCNVDLLKIIQLGLTFFNKEGETPEGVCTWQVRAS